METPATDNSGAFKPTRWSLVLQAAGGQTPASTRALDEICRACWHPLYYFARRRGLAVPDAEDATQSFFARILESELLSRADPEKGRLRTYLLTAFQRHLSDLEDHRFAKKRGGTQGTLSLDAAEALYLQEPADLDTPEKLFERRWTLSVLASVLAALEGEWAAEGRQEAFALLRGFLCFGGEETPESYREVAAQLGGTPGAARVTVHRLRKRYREILFSHVADTLSEPTPSAINDEIHAMLAALG